MKKLLKRLRLEVRGGCCGITIVIYDSFGPLYYFS